MSQSSVKSQSAPPRLHFRVPPEASHLLRARERLRDYLSQYCAEQRVIDEVVLCVEEAATNAIRHSASAQDMEISLRFQDGDLVAEVRDQGHGFDIAAFDPEELPDLLSDHGRGLFLISKLSDELQLSCDGGLEVRMVKRAVALRESVVLESGFGDLQSASDLSHRDLRLRALLEEIDEGFFALDWECRYVHANATGLQMAGKPLQELVGRTPWEVFPALRGSELEKRYRQAMELGRPSVLEHRSVVSGDWLEVRIYPTPAGASAYYRQINDRKRADLERETTVGFLRLINESDSLVALVRAATTFFQAQSGCEAVGIRLRDGEDYPYFESRGFPAEFVELESNLCARDHEGQLCRDAGGYPIMECMCGNVICGRFDAAQEFFSERGSFWSSNTTMLLATSSEQDRQARTRNRCNGEGYESVALIALRVGEERIGLLQLNDRRMGHFAPEDIALWERLADQLAAAVAKLRLEEELHESQEHYRTLFDAMLEGFCVIEVIFDHADRPVDYRFLEINPAFEERTGLHEAQGKLMRELAPDHEQHWFDIYGKVALTGEPARFMAPAEALGRYYDVSAFRVGEPENRQVAILFDDISERHRAELEGRRLLEESQAQGEELQAQAEELQTQAEEMQIQGEELRAQSEELFTQRDELLRESELRAGLNALTLLLHSTLKPDEVMRRALVEATRVLAIDAAAIALPEGDTWPVRFAAGLPPEALGSPLTGEPAISRLLAHSGEVLVLDQVTDHETVDPFATRLGVRSLMAVPLIAQEQVIGTLLLVERRTTRHFTEAEIDFARRLGTSVSLALENARLFEAEREAQRNAGEELQATTRLLEAARALADWRDLGEVVRALAQTLLHSTAHTRAMVSLWDEGRGEFELIAAEGLRPMPLGSRWAMDVSSTAAVKAVTQRSAQVWDLDALPEAKRGQQWADYQPHLALHVPLVGREKVVGLLSLDDPGERREFGEREIKLVEGIAANATVAIENARLFSNTLEQSQHLTNVLQSMTDGFVSVDRTWCYTLVNPQAERLIGRPAAELLGKSMEELFPDMYGWSHYSKVMSERLPETFETWSVPLKTWLEIRAYPTLDGMSILFSDISTRKAAAEELRLHNEELAEGARLADSLNAINRLLHATLDFDTIMQGALDEGVGALGAHAGMIAMREESQWVVRYQHGLAEADVGLRLSAAEAPVAARVEERGEPVVVADAKADGAVSIGFVRKHSLGSLLAAPLVARGAVIGCMVFYGASVRAFSDSEIDFARKLGATVSLAVENARLYEEQQRIAQTLQENFVHEPPEVPGLELGVVSNTAFEPELVGGDFSDVFVVDDTHVVLLIGDVAGKGVRAAGMTETVRSTVRALASADPSPAFVLAKANELLLRFDPDEPHVTAFLAVLDPNTGHLSYASAGHPAPVHLSAYACRPLDTTFGPPLGSFERSYTNGHTVLTLDDYLVLYTDGVTEARRGLELLGETRLLEIVAGLRGRPVQEVADGVRDAALAFADKLSDDLQVVVLRLA